MKNTFWIKKHVIVVVQISKSVRIISILIIITVNVLVKKAQNVVQTIGMKKNAGNFIEI